MSSQQLQTLSQASKQQPSSHKRTYTEAFTDEYPFRALPYSITLIIFTFLGHDTRERTSIAEVYGRFSRDPEGKVHRFFNLVETNGIPWRSIYGYLAKRITLSTKYCDIFYSVSNTLDQLSIAQPNGTYTIKKQPDAQIVFGKEFSEPLENVAHLLKHCPTCFFRFKFFEYDRSNLNCQRALDLVRQLGSLPSDRYSVKISLNVRPGNEHMMNSLDTLLDHPNVRQVCLRIVGVKIPQCNILRLLYDMQLSVQQRRKLHLDITIDGIQQMSDSSIVQFGFQDAVFWTTFGDRIKCINFDAIVESTAVDLALIGQQIRQYVLCTVNSTAIMHSRTNIYLALSNSGYFASDNCIHQCYLSERGSKKPVDVLRLLEPFIYGHLTKVVVTGTNLVEQISVSQLSSIVKQVPNADKAIISVFPEDTAVFRGAKNTYNEFILAELPQKVHEHKALWTKIVM